MVALVHPVYDCLTRLAQPDALMNEEEVSMIIGFVVFFFFVKVIKQGAIWGFRRYIKRY